MVTPDSTCPSFNYSAVFHFLRWRCRARSGREVARETTLRAASRWKAGTGDPRPSLARAVQGFLALSCPGAEDAEGG